MLQGLESEVITNSGDIVAINPGEIDQNGSYAAAEFQRLPRSSFDEYSRHIYQLEARAASRTLATEPHLAATASLDQ